MRALRSPVGGIHELPVHCVAAFDPAISRYPALPGVLRVLRHQVVREASPALTDWFAHS